MDYENEENLDYYQPGIFLFVASSKRPMSNLSLQELTLLFHPTLSWIELEQWCPSNKQKRGMPLWAAVAKCYKKVLWPLLPTFCCSVNYSPTSSYISCLSCHLLLCLEDSLEACREGFMGRMTQTNSTWNRVSQVLPAVTLVGGAF